MKNPFKYVVIGDIGQWIGLILLIFAFGFMVSSTEFKVETVIVVSSILFALSTKIKYYGKRRFDDMLAGRRRQLIHLNGGHTKQDRRKEVKA